MSITQTVDIPDSYQLTIDVPRELPVGRTILTFTPAKKPEDQRSETQDIEIINSNAEWLNREAEDVLAYQSLDVVEENLDRFAVVRGTVVPFSFADIVRPHQEGKADL